MSCKRTICNSQDPPPLPSPIQSFLPHTQLGISRREDTLGSMIPCTIMITFGAQYRARPSQEPKRPHQSWCRRLQQLQVPLHWPKPCAIQGRPEPMASLRRAVGGAGPCQPAHCDYSGPEFSRDYKCWSEHDVMESRNVPELLQCFWPTCE